MSRGRGPEELRPVVLLGAARSGTKILRDALGTALPAGVVPYDVGYVWRHGNESEPDDCLDPELAGPAARRFVRGFLGRYAGPDGLVVEKTVGNTLRAPFVERVLPDARFVHLVRDGVEVAVSARRQWQAAPDLGYLTRKARHFPLRLLPTYGRTFLVAATVGRIGAGRVVRTWGPRYPGIEADVRVEDLLTVCARQWRACVETARADLVGTPNTVEVRYERLVAEPERVLADLASHCGVATRPARLRTAAAMVVRRDDLARTQLTAAERDRLGTEIGDVLEELGYAAP